MKVSKNIVFIIGMLFVMVFQFAGGVYAGTDTTIHMEAEDGQINSFYTNITLADDPEASGGKCVAVPVLAEGKRDRMKAGFKVTFTAAETDIYTYWARLIAPKGISEYIHITINGESTKFRRGSSFKNWTWVNIKSVSRLTKGEHTLSLGRLKAGMKFDKIKIVPVSSQIPTGSVKLKPPFDMPKWKEPSFPNRTFNIIDYGAKPDGRTMNTKAFAAAIEACSKAGGGKVLVPDGLWLTGPIHLKSNINLHLAKGCEIRFSDNFADYLPVVFTRCDGMECYNYSALIYAKDCENIAITGTGYLNGQGRKWWDYTENAHHPDSVKILYDMVLDNVPVEKRIFGSTDKFIRPGFIEFVSCRNALIEGITVGSGPMWTLHPIYTENLIVRNMSIINFDGVEHNDGITPNSCKNLIIENCYLSTYDDSITLKSGVNEDGWRVGKACENIVIRNCHSAEGNGGVVIGSEMSGGVRNVFAHNCRIDHTLIGIRFKSMRGRGGVVENCWFQDLQMGRTYLPVRLTMFYGASTLKKPSTDKPGIFRNIHIKNITCERAAYNPVVITGLPEKPIENISVENISVGWAKGGIECTDAKNIRINNINFEQQKGPFAKITDSEDVVISNSAASAKVETFLELSGAKSKKICLTGNDMSKAKKDIITTDGASTDAVTVK